MNDLERARWLLAEGTDEVEVRALADVLAVVRREGAEEMRERAARVCEGGYTTGSTASTLKAIAAAIRALKAAQRDE